MNVVDKLKSALISSRGRGGSRRGTHAENFPINRFGGAMFPPPITQKYGSSSAKMSESKPFAGIVQLPSTSTSLSVWRSGGRTTSSTPYTAKTKRSSATPKISAGPPIIIAITEGRGDARGEVGIAAINMQHPHLILSQISDRHSYLKTLTKILVFNPIEIIMPDTMVGNKETSGKLYECIREKFQQLNIAAVSRQHFSNANGLDRIKTLCAPEYCAVEFYVKQKFYALAAASALLKYVEYTQNMLYIAKTMKIEFQSSEDTTIIDIDIESAQSLELVTHQKHLDKFTLLGVLDECLTPGGKRLLRATILQPSCKERVIKERQACISELVEDSTLIISIKSHIRKLSDVDQLLALGLNTGHKDNATSAQKNLNYVLFLKTTLETIPLLRTALTTTKAKFFAKVCENLEDPRYSVIMDTISKVLQPEARHASGFNFSIMQRCFALKSGLNDMLDIARQAYCELIDDMKGMVETLALKYNLPLALACSASMGYHIQMESPNKSRPIKETDLPPVFVEVHKHRSSYLMTTQTLLVLSQRCRDACDELYLMSNVMLKGILDAIMGQIGCLHQLSNDVAELDVLVSLASISSLSNYVKPTFGLRIELENSIHPLMNITGTCTPVPNDVHASLPHNFNIITGPNMGGKSVYLRQIVMLQIMAQIGCYVPADKAQFRITDRIFCRLCFEDSIECNASSFVLEVKETQYILQTVTPTSLIIIDELCRGTTVEEGESIAFSICEQLLNTSAFVFFTTHFQSLTQLAELYPNVTNYHLETKYRPIEGFMEPRLIYTHKLRPGMVVAENYGLALAEASGIHASIVKEARICAAELTNKIQLIQLDRQTSNAERKKYYEQVSIIQKKIEDCDLSEVDFLEAGRRFCNDEISMSDGGCGLNSKRTAVSTASSELSITEKFNRFRQKRLLDGSTSNSVDPALWRSSPMPEAGLLGGMQKSSESDPMGPSPSKKLLLMQTPNPANRHIDQQILPKSGPEKSHILPVPLSPKRETNLSSASIVCINSPDKSFPDSVNKTDFWRKSSGLDSELFPNISNSSNGSSVIELLSQLSTDTIEAKITARQKEAKIFRQIEGDRFKESEFFGSVFSQDSRVDMPKDIKPK